MKTNLLQLSFTNSTQKSAQQWTVTTREKWDYTYMYAQDGSVASQNTVLYDLNYNMTKKDANWMIDSIEVLSAKETEKGNDLNFLQRPENMEKEGR